MRDRDLVGQRADCRREALVAQHDRLEIEGEIAQLADRGAVPLQGPSDDLAGLFVAALGDRVQPRVEEQRDPGE